MPPCKNLISPFYEKFAFSSVAGGGEKESHRYIKGLQGSLLGVEN